MWRDRRIRVGGAVAGAVALAALIGPWFAPDPLSTASAHLLGPSWAHPMGTDASGRDVWARWLAGARTSLGLAAVATGVATVLGVGVGGLAGAVGGWVDRAARFAIDGLLVVPRLVVLLAVLAVAGWRDAAHLALLAFLIGATSWMGLARVVRAEVRSLVRRDFVLAARATGAHPLEIWARHVLPHVAAYALVFAATAAGQAVLAEAALSWLGLGVTPPTPSWGDLVKDGRDCMNDAPWVVSAGAMGITATVLAFHLLGDGLRDLADPRTNARGPGAR